MLGTTYIEDLKSALSHRKMDEGFQLLGEWQTKMGAADLSGPGSSELLLLVAQWVDVGYRDYRILDTLIERFPRESRGKLPMTDYSCLRMAEAFRDFAANHLDSAITKLDMELRTCSELPNSSHEALAHFWIGRAYRKKGEYGTALKHITKAREMAQENRDEIFKAVIQIQESWLLFQKGTSKEALQTLDLAEAALTTTDHYVALGNIESARGRIVRRTGEYSRALEYYSRALDVYSRRDANHVNVARTLVNMAHAQRLLALQLRKRIDTRADKSQADTIRPGIERRETILARHQALWRNAVHALTRAHEIYALHEHFDGIGKVSLNLGYLHLDSGDIESAWREGSQAFLIGRKQSDHILMARARILQAAIENAHVEEQTGEELDVAVHANDARQYSDEALRLARETQNRRLLAGALIARGTTAANDFFQEWDSARRYASEAGALIGPGENDQMVEDLAKLKSRIVKASGINDTLRGWSEGIVGDKTFQQIIEEFAEIVIPKVWLKSDRKVSRVASALSVSPKKVRRILRNSGFLGQ